MITATSLPTRPLGRTGREVSLFGLGGEGVLRTHGRQREAVAVIHTALDAGVTYFDTAPAYDSSLDYYGAALAQRDLGAGEARGSFVLASKTADRSRDGSLRILDDTLKRLGTDYLDTWQLHDLRTRDELDRIFAKDGAIEALKLARSQGRIRYCGLTGHHDPAILLEAMRRFDFDTALVSLNPADGQRLPFIPTVLADAANRGMGVIAMKCSAQGAMLAGGAFSMGDCMGYTLSLPGVSNVIVGCKTPDEVTANAAFVRQFAPLAPAALRGLEKRAAPQAARYCYFKK